MRAIVSELVRQERLAVLEDFSLELPKTRALVEKLNQLNLGDVLVVVERPGDNLELAVRNLHWAAVLAAKDVNPVSLLAFDKVLATVEALRVLERRLG